MRMNSVFVGCLKVFVVACLLVVKGRVLIELNDYKLLLLGIASQEHRSQTVSLICLFDISHLAHL